MRFACALVCVRVCDQLPERRVAAGVYFVKSGSTLCPLPASFDAESVFLCFLGVGIVAMWLGASQLACEPLDASLTQRLVSEPKSKYFR